MSFCSVLQNQWNVHERGLWCSLMYNGATVVLYSWEHFNADAKWLMWLCRYKSIRQIRWAFFFFSPHCVFLSGLWLQPVSPNLDKLVNLQVIIRSLFGSSSPSHTDRCCYPLRNVTKRTDCKVQLSASDTLAILTGRDTWGGLILQTNGITGLWLWIKMNTWLYIFHFNYPAAICEVRFLISHPVFISSICMACATCKLRTWLISRAGRRAIEAVIYTAGSKKQAVQKKRFWHN